MNRMFDTFDLWRDDDLEDDRPFVVACKDIENTGDRWVLTSLSEDEARQVYEYLKKHFDN